MPVALLILPLLLILATFLLWFVVLVTSSVVRAVATVVHPHHSHTPRR